MVKTLTDPSYVAGDRGAPPWVGNILADVIAKALLRAEALITDGKLDAFRAERYAGWQGELGQAIKGASLAEIADMAVARDLAPKPVSGRQEWLENLLNRF